MFLFFYIFSASSNVARYCIQWLPSNRKCVDNGTVVSSMFEIKADPEQTVEIEISEPNTNPIEYYKVSDNMIIYSHDATISKPIIILTSTAKINKLSLSNISILPQVSYIHCTNLSLSSIMFYQTINLDVDTIYSDLQSLIKLSSISANNTYIYTKATPLFLHDLHITTVNLTLDINNSDFKCLLTSESIQVSYNKFSMIFYILDKSIFTFNINGCESFFMPEKNPRIPDSFMFKFTDCGVDIQDPEKTDAKFIFEGCTINILDTLISFPCYFKGYNKVNLIKGILMQYLRCDNSVIEWNIPKPDHIHIKEFFAMTNLIFRYNNPDYLTVRINNAKFQACYTNETLGNFSITNMRIISSMLIFNELNILKSIEFTETLGTNISCVKSNKINFKGEFLFTYQFLHYLYNETNFLNHKYPLIQSKIAVISLSRKSLTIEYTQQLSKAIYNWNFSNIERDYDAYDGKYYTNLTLSFVQYRKLTDAHAFLMYGAAKPDFPYRRIRKFFEWRDYLTNVTQDVVIEFGNLPAPIISDTLDISGLEHRDFTLTIRSSPNFQHRLLFVATSNIPDRIIIENINHFSFLGPVSECSMLIMLGCEMVSHVDLSNVTHLLIDEDVINYVSYSKNTTVRIMANHRQSSKNVHFKNNSVLFNGYELYNPPGLTLEIYATDRATYNVSRDANVNDINPIGFIPGGEVIGFNVNKSFTGYKGSQCLDIQREVDVDYNIEAPVFLLILHYNNDVFLTGKLDYYTGLVEIPHNIYVYTNVLTSYLSNQIIINSPVLFHNFKFLSPSFPRIIIANAYVLNFSVNLKHVQFTGSLMMQQNMTLYDWDFDDCMIYVEGDNLQLTLQSSSLQEQLPKKVILTSVVDNFTIKFDAGAFFNKKWVDVIKSELPYTSVSYVQNADSILFQVIDGTPEKNPLKIAIPIIMVFVFIVLMITFISIMIYCYKKKRRIVRASTLNTELFETVYLDDKSY